jgi:hypothetical protein
MICKTKKELDDKIDEIVNFFRERRNYEIETEDEGSIR